MHVIANESFKPFGLQQQQQQRRALHTLTEKNVSGLLASDRRGGGKIYGPMVCLRLEFQVPFEGGVTK